MERPVLGVAGREGAIELTSTVKSGCRECQTKQEANCHQDASASGTLCRGHRQSRIRVCRVHCQRPRAGHKKVGLELGTAVYKGPLWLASIMLGPFH